MLLTLLLIDFIMFLCALIGYVMQYRLSKIQKESVCFRYSAGESSEKLAIDFGISSVAIRGILKRRNITIRSAREAQIRCELDESAFDVITPESAYWAGFLFADGCLFHRSGSPSLTLRLSAIDAAHVSKFQKFLKSTHKLIIVKASETNIKTKKSVQFQCRSQRLVSRLIEIGMNGLDSEPITELRQSRDFWRGVIDGDGSLNIYHRKSYFNKHPRINAWSIPRDDKRLELVGGKQLLESFINFLKEKYPDIKNSVRPHKSIFRVGLAGATAEKVIDLLYSDCIVALDRKLNAAKNIRNEAQRMIAAGTVVTANRGIVSQAKGRKSSVLANAVEVRSPVL